MLNSAVSGGYILASRLISGFLAMSLDHPLFLGVIVLALAGIACAALLDVLGRGSGTATMDERPIRLRRS